MSNVKEWIPDQRTESVLKYWGVEWDLKLLNVSQIDEKESHKNQARPEAIDHETVESYTMSMKNGAIFPAIVVLKTRSGYINLGGNHRLAAAKGAGRKQILCYVIETDDSKVLTLMPKALNTVEGRRPDRQHLLASALQAVKEFSWKAKQAADAFNISHSSVLDAIRADETASRLREKRAPDSFKRDHLVVMSSVDNDNVLAQVGKIAKDAKLSGDELRQLVKDVKEERTELGQMSRLGDYAKRLGVNDSKIEERPKHIQTPEFSKWRKAQTTFEKLIEGKRTIQQMGAHTPVQVAEMTERLNDLIKELRQILSRSTQYNGRSANGHP